MPQPDLRRHHIEVVTHLDDVRPASVDLVLISQVCLNLYLNARDAILQKGGGGGTLDVSLAAREGRDHGTGGHSQRVSVLTTGIARALGIAGSALIQIEHGALLHDIGKSMR